MTSCQAKRCVGAVFLLIVSFHCLSNDLIGSEKKVFAHYMTSFPQKITDGLPGEDYYDTNYLTPDGENRKFFSVGGFIRERPISRAPLSTPATEWTMTDARFSVRQAAAIGIDGFALNLFGNTGFDWSRTLRLFSAAEELGDFSILIVPDMSTGFQGDDPNTQFVPTVRALAAYDSAYRLSDGRVVVSPYLTNLQSPAWWKKALDTLKSEGVNVALVPLYQGWNDKLALFREQEPEAYAEYVVGVSEWGPRTPTAAYNQVVSPSVAHEQNLMYMAPVSPQDSRPRSFIYNEAGNSEAYRGLWESAINGGADWVKIITWNDYGESTQISPSTQIGYSFYDLTAYYIEWFKTGVKPQIENDTIFGFYREHSTESRISGEVQSRTVQVVNGEAPRNEIELLALLTDEAVLEIEIDGDTYQQAASAGMVSFKVPLQEGKPIFRIIRNNQIIEEIQGPTDITIDKVLDVQDMTYWGVSSISNRRVQNEQYISWPRKTDSESASFINNTSRNSPFDRHSNVRADLLDFRNGYWYNGFTYSFVPVPENSPTVVTFDVNLLSYCLGQSTLVMKLSDGKGNSGIYIELCSREAETTNLQNITSEGRFDIPNTAMEPNSWRQIRIITSPIAQYSNKYEILVTKEDGSSSGHKGVLVNSKIKEFNTISLGLSYSTRHSVPIVIDNISVTSTTQTF